MASQLEQYMALFVTALGADTIGHPLYGKVLLGRTKIDRNTDAPRIVVYRVGGSIAPPDQVGMGEIDLGPPTGKIRTRAIATRKLSVQTYCHGKSDEETEDLLNNAIAAWRKVLHNDVRFGSETWISQEGSHNDRRGEEVSFDLEIWFRVYDIQYPLTIVDGFTDEDVWGADSEAIDCRPPEESE